MSSPSFYDTIKLQILTGRMDMSIVLGFIGIDGIVLATDSKRTESNYSENAQKLWELTPNIGLMTFGYSGKYRSFLVNYYKELNLATPDFRFINDTADTLSFFTKTHINRFVTSEDLKVLTAYDINFSFILAGYDQQGNPKLFAVESNSLTPFVPLDCSQYYYGGVKDVGLYWAKKVGLKERLETGGLPCDFLKKFAVMVIRETTVFSSMVGEPIQMAVITKGNDYKSISNDDIESIKSTLDSENKWLFDYMKQLKEAQ